jgi:hypothetical protein
LKVASDGWIHITRISILHLGYGPIYPQLHPQAIFLAISSRCARQNAIRVQQEPAFLMSGAVLGVISGWKERHSIPAPSVKSAA